MVLNTITMSTIPPVKILVTKIRFSNNNNDSNDDNDHCNQNYYFNHRRSFNNDINIQQSEPAKKEVSINNHNSNNEETCMNTEHAPHSRNTVVRAVVILAITRTSLVMRKWIVSAFIILKSYSQSSSSYKLYLYLQ